MDNLGDFEKKYGYRNSFDDFYYRYRTSEERWAFIARNLCMILDAETGQPYKDLFEILKGKNYYILTTNQDTQFTRDFPEKKISAIQGDWQYFQCSRRCHDELYDSVETLHKLKDAIVPEELKQKGLAIREDIAKVLEDARKISGGVMK